MDRKATARWNGDLKSGTGNVRLGSGSFEGEYSFGTRFESASGTNPEELLGAAHAACFSMAFASALAKAGHEANHVETDAVVRLGMVGEGFQITSIDLATHGDVPGISAEEFARIAEDIKTNCIVSKALASVPMTVKATLVG
ncbi:MAG: OsmC family peroxiredoxin [Gemmatimonadales bacterium]|nr:OsmC family peroxiredoxin [Gemmatimonadales bacterium]